MSLKELRISYGLSQQEASQIVEVPLRTYIRYEADNSYGSSLKRKTIINTLKEQCEITENKGLLSIDSITLIVSELFDSEFKGVVDFCYLFGSYAKGYAKEDSDVDLCVSTSLTGFGFIGLHNRLSEVLHKKVDLIRVDTLKDNIELLNEIMKDGIRIYGQLKK